MMDNNKNLVSVCPGCPGESCMHLGCFGNDMGTCIGGKKDDNGKNDTG